MATKHAPTEVRSNLSAYTFVPNAALVGWPPVPRASVFEPLDVVDAVADISPAPKAGWIVRVLTNTVVRNGIRLEEVKDVTVIDNDQAWFYTPEWQAGEIRADEQAEAGLGTRYASLDDFLNDLK